MNVIKKSAVAARLPVFLLSGDSLRKISERLRSSIKNGELDKSFAQIEGERPLENRKKSALRNFRVTKNLKF